MGTCGKHVTGIGIHLLIPGSGVKKHVNDHMATYQKGPHASFESSNHPFYRWVIRQLAKYLTRTSCFGSQIAVGCGVTMESTIRFPLWYILLHIALSCLSGTYCMPLGFVWYLFEEVL